MEGCRTPEDGLGAVGVEDLGVELAGSPDAASQGLSAKMEGGTKDTQLRAG